MTTAPFAPPPLPLRTGRLLLRAVQPTDLADMLDYDSRPEVVRHLPYGVLDAAAMGEKIEKLRSHVAPQATGDTLTLAMEHEGRVVGDLMLMLGTGEPPSVAEVGWVSHPAVGGRGLVTEGARAVVELAFAHYGVHRVEARLDVRNTASARLCERLGMTREACLRRAQPNKGEWCDMLVYGLLVEEWERRT